MTRRKGAKADRAARDAGFTEETLHLHALRAGTIATNRPIRHRGRSLPSGFGGIDYATRAGGMIVSFGNPRISDDVGATVSSLDWDEKSYQRRKVAGGTSLTTTSTGGKRLHAAGPGQPEQAKQVAK